jgi:hypothetical protein
MLFAWLNVGATELDGATELVGATELDGATDVEDPSEVTLDETVVPQAANTTASVDINVPFLICMFIDLPPNEFIRIQYKRLIEWFDEDCVKI